jgi:3-deoxy-7-phosphoheptulonate synthase
MRIRQRDYRQLNSIRAAQNSHTFIYSGWKLKRPGPATHGNLREPDPSGRTSPIITMKVIYIAKNMKNNNWQINIIVDANHANSMKHYYNNRESPAVLMSRIIMVTEKNSRG